ncbi:polyprenyl diphosphate synthase [Neorickettsia risticii]|uniref:Isoprenyl transferase n=1 Tax=Neorickettsia risticii (strain Illinois) TaxID=434131 RepID=C6V651_NEORI|nr:polyprenyl diphosphate synthase [Neorickettsia risticii]ACT69865.1 undecaprenyl diphosphate synthase [Neorickettsia risticii str. Illinois]
MIGKELPVHIAIIMDGNARWARARGLCNSDGYKMGVEAAFSAVRASCNAGIPYLTLFLFSTENWSRNPDDVRLVFSIFEKASVTALNELCDANIKVKVIGERLGLGKSARQVIKNLESGTAKNSGMYLCLAINYGGRSEIINAVSRMINDGLRAEEVDVQKLASYLYTDGIPDPDLIIRTAGEKRLSNFLLWQSSYSELYFCDTLWPDFTEKDLEMAMEAYKVRCRKYGK